MFLGRRENNLGLRSSEILFRHAFSFFSRPSSPLPPALLAFSDEENVWKRLVHKPWPPLTSEKPDTNTNFGFLEQVVVFGICAVRAR